MNERVDKLRAAKTCLLTGKAAGMDSTAMPVVATASMEMPPLTETQAAKPAKKDAGALVVFKCGHTRQLKEMLAVDCNKCKNEARSKRCGIRKAAAKPNENKNRLPDGSQFEFRYDAAKMEWEGVIMAGDFAAQARGSAVFKLLSCLDAMYRAWLQTQKGTSD